MSEIPVPRLPKCAEAWACKPAVHVAAGAAWLDQVAPGWERKVDVSILDLEDPSVCICGQVVPLGEIGAPYLAVRDHLLATTPGPVSAPMCHLGFVSSNDQDAWVALIKQRFDSGTLSDEGQPEVRNERRAS